MTIREVRDTLKQRLTPAVGTDEARAMANIIIEDVKGYTPTQLIMYADRTLLDETVDRMMRIADRVLAGEPLQYVIGTARFRGRDFKVTPDVLIPRPETGQLVDMIVDQYGGQSSLSVLDLGTGSGCIAISLALDLRFADITAIDVSEAALAVADDNAKLLSAKIHTIQADIYTFKPSDSYDIIVSNPPYIMESERASMEARVKDYEPSGALFVPDTDPIAIYKAIARIADTCLKSRGRLYLEINPLCATQLSEMLRRYFADVQIICDFRGRQRFAVAQK